MAGNENDGQGVVALEKLFLQLEATKPGHPDIKDKAARALIAYLFQKFISGAEDFMLKIDRVHECLHGNPDGGVVIDDKYRR